MRTKMRQLSLVTGFVGLSFFVQGFYTTALSLRIVTESLRIWTFQFEGKRDQVILSGLSIVACAYGIIRLTSNP